MRTISLSADIPANRELRITLPADIPAGPAGIVLVVSSDRIDIKDSVSFAGQLRREGWERPA